MENKYSLSVNGAELYTAPNPHACLTELAYRFPTMTVKNAVVLGYSIDPVQVGVK